MRGGNGIEQAGSISHCISAYGRGESSASNRSRGRLARIRAGQSHRWRQSTEHSREMEPQRIHTKPINSSRPKKCKKCAINCFTLIICFNSIIGSPGKVKQVGTIGIRFRVFQLFHLNCFNSIIQVLCPKGETEIVFLSRTVHVLPSVCRATNTAPRCLSGSCAGC